MSPAESSGVAPPREARRTGRAPSVALVVLAALAVGPRAFAQSLAAPVPAALVARAASFDVAERAGAIVELQALATPAAWELVLVILQRDYDPRARAAAAAALGTSGDPAYLEALRYAAGADADPNVRAAAEASAAALAPFGKRPKLAAGLSVLCPGCGYFYLGQSATAAHYLAGAAGLLATGLVVLRNSPLDSDGNRSAGRSTPLFMAVQNLWFYGIYATYRDARLARGDAGARYPVAREDVGDLLFAPFNPRVLKSPWVWAGVPLMLTAALGASYVFSKAEPSSDSMSSSMRTLGDGGGVQFFGKHYGTATGFVLGDAYNVSLYLPVGVGEEALFRGVVQAGLSETPLGLWGGWAVGSAIFGAAHTFNFIGDEDGFREAALAVPYLMLTGSYLGFLYVHSNFSLKQGAAVHFWYDFLLGTLDFISDPDHQPFVARFGMPF
ncbi:MAG TPA: CPBP family intramembrane glutamic endopeptidase [Polyangia bacterium]|nr:CPBP family intramembrane glutamic endopeptidase [Polyangia bacterium]